VAKKRLEAKLANVLKVLEEDFLKAETEVGAKLKLIDKDSDGVVTTEEIGAAIELLRDKPSEREIVEVLRVRHRPSRSF
jgi:Ca2+-binding EF-hand superfamily protein